MTVQHPGTLSDAAHTHAAASDRSHTEVDRLGNVAGAGYDTQGATSTDAVSTRSAESNFEYLFTTEAKQAVGGQTRS